MINYEFYSLSDFETEKVQQLVGQIPWGHNILIITKAKNIKEAIFMYPKHWKTTGLEPPYPFK